MTSIAGSPDDIRAQHQTYGSASASAYAQAGAITRSLVIIGRGSFSGPAAVRAQQFLGKLHDYNLAAVQAFDRVGSQLPKVAEAVEDAQKAERAKDQAEKALDAAQTASDTAEKAVTTAQAEATAAADQMSHATAVTASAAAGRLSAATSDLARANTAAQKASATLDTARSAYTRATAAFTVADERRVQLLAAFANTCIEETTPAACTLPSAPTPGVIPAADRGLQLVNAALTFADLPDSVRASLSKVITGADPADDGADGAGGEDADAGTSAVAGLGDLFNEEDPSSSTFSKSQAYLDELLRMLAAAGSDGAAQLSGLFDQVQATETAEAAHCPLFLPPKEPEEPKDDLPRNATGPDPLPSSAWVLGGGTVAVGTGAAASGGGAGLVDLLGLLAFA